VILRLHFAESSNRWAAAAINVERGEDPIVLGTFIKPFPKRKAAIIAAKKKQDPIGHRSASQKLWKEVLADIQNAETFADFRAAFIRAVQSQAIGRAAAGLGVTIVVEDFGEYWTEDFINRMAVALRRPRTREELSIQKAHLVAAWPNGLSKMDRRELTAHMNKTFKKSKPMSEAGVWKMVDRAGLFSERAPGPKSSLRQPDDRT
jgi:hypothetical protein